MQTVPFLTTYQTAPLTSAGVEEEEEVDPGRMEKRERARDLEGPHPPIPEKVRSWFPSPNRHHHAVLIRIPVFIMFNFDAPMWSQSLRYFSLLPIAHFVQQGTCGGESM